jgi:SpoIID/LytB domain protein
VTGRRLLLAVAIACAVQGSSRDLGGVSPQDGVVRPARPVTSLRVGIAKPGGGYSIQTMALDDYVARVLAGEAVRDSKPAALEALAITVRTFALANLGRHRADGFDMCDQTHCQVVRASTPATERAAAATSGRILRDASGAPALVYYTASCGGRTEVPSAVWPGADDPPFLPSRADDACGGAPEWSADITDADLLRALRAAGFEGGRLRGVSIESRDRSGRVAWLRLEGVAPERISGQELRVAVGRTLGWQYIKSTAFELRREGRSSRFSGHGSGHGVGLCVIGSARLAERGATPESILARYFPGLEDTGARHVPGTGPSEGESGGSPSKNAQKSPILGARHVPGTEGAGGEGIVLSLAEGDEGGRAAIVREVQRAKDDLTKTLGAPAPATLTLRFHPTTDDYERATGQAWFTSGALVRGELHLLPLAVLRDRGILDRTIRFFLVHVMLDAALASRPAWVREGAAMYFAGGGPMPADVPQRPAFRPTARAACPTDAELEHPVSIGQLSNAHARARACFAREIASGKKWQDVR